MQLIGTRENSSWRADADFFVKRHWFHPGVDPTTGGPIRVVEDFTDTPVTAKAGHEYRLDLDPSSRTFRQVIEAPIDPQRMATEAVQQLANPNPQLQQQQQIDPNTGLPIG